MGDLLIFRLNVPTKDDAKLDELHAKLVAQMKTGVILLPANVQLIYGLKMVEEE